MKKPWKEIFKEVKERNKKIQLKQEKKEIKIEDYLFSQRRILSTGCWIWTGLHLGGYGVVYIPEFKKKIRVHRLSLLIFNPEEYAKEGTSVCHKCNVKSCFNPDHLYKGTAKTNSDDYLRDLAEKDGKIEISCMEIPSTWLQKK